MNAVVATEQTPEPLSSATSLIQVIERVASNPNINLEIMDRLFAHHRDMVALDAERAFNEAMSECQREMPQVERDAENEQTHSWYSRLETLSDAAVPVYTKHGFSLSFNEEDCPKEGHIRVVCYCSHRAGHTRKYRGDLPIDIAGIKGNVNKTPTHAFGSTKSYGRRYLTLDIFNIVMKGEDDDGNTGGGKVPNDRHDPRPDISRVDTKSANAYCKRVIEAINNGNARLAADLRAELSEDAALFTVVWGMLAKPLKDKFEDLLDEAQKDSRSR